MSFQNDKIRAKKLKLYELTLLQGLVIRAHSLISQSLLECITFGTKVPSGLCLSTRPFTPIQLFLGAADLESHQPVNTFSLPRHQTCSSTPSPPSACRQRLQ